MKRLVYSPSINVWIKSDSGVFDLSPYIIGFNIDRRINATSYARIQFRNPKVDNKMLFTEHEINGSIGPMFHPMDPIIITLTRLKGRPIQVFTGYCDTTPYVQLLPGNAELTASCTLKRLQYTYWDPALPFVRDFMNKTGWSVTAEGTAFNTDNRFNGSLHDGSIGYLLHQILKEIGGWNDKNIYIQELPSEQISEIVKKLYSDTAKENASSIKEFHEFLHQIIGASAYGSAGGSEPDTGSPVSTEKTKSGSRGPDWVERLISQACRKHGVDPNIIRAIIRAESDFNPNAGSGAGAVGLMQLMPQFVEEQSGYSANEIRTDNAKNIDAGVIEFKTYLKKYNGDIPLSLAAYNAGPVRADNGSWKTINETIAYVRKICKELGIASPV